MDSNSGDSNNSFDAIVELFLHQIRQDEDPSIEKFAEQYPHLSSEILRHFPGLKLAEKMAGQRHKGNTLELDLPKQIGNFKLVEEIGRGGMAVVYRAIHSELNREFAVKVMAEDNAESRKRVQRFRQEAQVIAKLHHPAIVPLFEFGSHNDLYFIAMRMIDGLTFRQIFAEWQSPIASELDHLKGNWKVLAGFFHEISQALDHVHQAGLIHSDIKPSNIMVDSDSRVWLADFGLAKLKSNENSGTPTGLVGTPRYIAPECVRGAADERSDIFSLGVTMFEMFSGIPAWGSKCLSFAGPDEHVLPSLRDIDNRVPRALAKIVKKATSLSPARRYPNVQHMAKDLRLFVLGSKRPIWQTFWPPKAK